MAKFLMQPLLNAAEPVTARLGTASGSANRLTDLDVDKAVKLIADSQYSFCAIGDPIEGFISAVNTAPADDFSVGGVFLEDRYLVTAEGSQAAGTGALAVGDYVVAGTQPALNAAVPTTGPNVRKATNQPGTAIVPADNTIGSITTAFAAMASQVKNAMFAWRVVSLGTAGTGAVGTQVVIERVTS
jgi:hypothetical protein